jgi:hypothetical protein
MGAAEFLPSPEHPVGWRGDGTGRYPGATPAIEWSETKNVVWKTPLPSWGNASPVPVGDRVFVTSELTTLVCVEAKTGKELWKREIDPNDALPAGHAQKGSFKLEAQHHPGEGHATPTPVSDGKQIYVFLGCGACAAFDMDGNRKWIVAALDPPAPYGNLSSSPALANGNLILHTGTAIVGLDAATGKRLWARNITGRACRASPVVGSVGQTTFVLTPNGDVLAPADGKVLAANLFKFNHTSPVIQGDVAYCFTGSKAKFTGRNQALRLTTTGASITTTKLWSQEWAADGWRPDDFCTSPVAYQGLICIVDHNGALLVFDANSGEPKPKRVVCEEAPKAQGHGSYLVFSSPCVAGNYLFVTHSMGTTVVYQGRDLKELGRNMLEPLPTTYRKGERPREPVRASLAFAGGRIYYRGATALYCIGQERP